MDGSFLAVLRETSTISWSSKSHRSRLTKCLSQFKQSGFLSSHYGYLSSAVQPIQSYDISTFTFLFLHVRQPL